MEQTLPYVMAMCRPETQTIFAADGTVQRDVLSANIEVFCDLIARAANDHGARLIAFPQFALTGYTPLGSNAWVEAGLTFPGPESDRIAEAAMRSGAYVVIQAPERHDAFPGRYFLSAAILTPAGEVGLVHRKNYAMSLRTSPNDVYDRFVDTFGTDALFPVLETPLGTLGLSIGAEVHWPEAIRALALKGAEVVINPVAAAPLLDYLERPGAHGVRAVRAFENMVYLGMTNIAFDGGPPSRIFDFNGGEIGKVADKDSMFTLADVDIQALRTARSSPAANFLAQIQPAIHENLDNLPLWPRNIFAEAAPAGADELIAVEAAAWLRLQNMGRGKAPV